MQRIQFTSWWFQRSVYILFLRSVRLVIEGPVEATSGAVTKILGDYELTKNGKPGLVHHDGSLVLETDLPVQDSTHLNFPQIYL